jgi:hypothetical protein
VAIIQIAKGGPFEVLGLWGGGRLTSQIIRDVPYAIVTLCMYELLQSFQTSQESHHGTVGADRAVSDAKWGAIAGGIGSLATTPMDVVKVRSVTHLLRMITLRVTAFSIQHELNLHHRLE